MARRRGKSRVGRQEVRDSGQRSGSRGQNAHRNLTRYSRWRAGTLILVYLLMTAHVVHWRVNGRTLAPLEFNEVMYTLELGIVTAGFLFMGVTMLGTFLFGRFFCSWACHILALQDLSAWLLSKMDIRPKPVRSRALLWIPALVAGYMFLWPQLLRLWLGNPVPLLHVRTDQDGWASFMTDDFWRNLPGPGVTMLTFVVVGFIIVYVLGSRSFCAYGCPYGAVFSLLDRFAPGRIRVKPKAACDQCGICTARCQSHIRVHEEIARFGMVVNPGCEKDLDCIAACPNEALRYGFGAPAVLKKVLADVPVRDRYDYAWYEEVALLAFFGASVVILRGLYDRVPFFLSIGLAVIVATGMVTVLRAVFVPNVSWIRYKLKTGGRLTRAGAAYCGALIVVLLFMTHSGIVHFHEWRGRRLALQASTVESGNETLLDQATKDLSFAQRWGLLSVDRSDLILADLHRRRLRMGEAESALIRLLGRSPGHFEGRMAMGRLMQELGRHEDSREHYQMAVAAAPSSYQARFHLAGAHCAVQRIDDAIEELRACIRIKPDFATAHCELGALLVDRNDVAAGIKHFRQAIAIDPAHPDSHYNLSVALAMTGAMKEAVVEIARAVELDPGDAQSQAFQAHLHSLQNHPPR